MNTPGGAGPGQVSYSVDANGSTSERSARITVNGQTHTVTQAAAAPACTYQVDPASASIGFGGGPGTFNVITQPGCAWTAASDQGWTAVNTPGDTGPGAVSYSVEANGTATERSARITVNGQTHTVTQAAAVAQLCEYRVQPGSASYGASGGNGAFNVITDDGCAWRAASAAQWTVVNTAEGSGPSQVTYRVEANSAPSGRATVIAVNGRLHFVLQGGASDDDDAAAMLNARLPGPPTDRRYCPSCSDQHSSYSR